MFSNKFDVVKQVCHSTTPAQGMHCGDLLNSLNSNPKYSFTGNYKAKKKMCSLYNHATSAREKLAEVQVQCILTM